MLGLITPAAASASTPAASRAVAGPGAHPAAAPAASGTSGVPAGAGVSAAAGTDWSVVPSPNAFARQGTLSDVSCTSPSRCIAVGSAVKPASLEPVTLAEVWNGRSWAVQRTPSATRFADALTGVSCTSARACTAVGAGAAERWNGTKWVTQAVPINPIAVSCGAAKFCATAGSDTSAIWRGRKWVAYNFVGFDEPPFTDPHMTSISCTSASACIAVGYAQDTDREPARALVNRWNGRKWVRQRFPTGSSIPNGVSCTSATACLTVGGGRTGPQADRWNGMSWQPTTAPAGGPSAVLDHVSCTSATRCMATGTSAGSEIAETWDGSSWRLLGSPVQPGDSSLNALSCTSARACMLVGAHQVIGDAFHKTLAESWNGAKWTVRPPVNPRGRLASNLFGVSCAAAHACMAVGMTSDYDSDPKLALAEVWNGRRWSVTPTPRLDASNGAALNAVSCVSAADCTAVGYFDDSTTHHGLIEHWNGRRWTVPPAPDIFGEFAGLSSVSCTSATACTAVGAGSNEPIAETWNGTTWSTQTLPAGAGAVSCSAADACTAVGGLTAQRWDGKNWTVQDVPSPVGGSGFALSSVSCTSATACTAVGSGRIGGAVFWSMLAVAWNGTDWTSQPTPQAATRSLFPLAVSCTTAAACTAVGRLSRPGVHHAVALHWNGTKWTIQPTPYRAFSRLQGVSCRSATTCTAVGRWYNNQIKALIERRT